MITTKLECISAKHYSSFDNGRGISFPGGGGRHHRRRVQSHETCAGRSKLHTHASIGDFIPQEVSQDFPERYITRCPATLISTTLINGRAELTMVAVAVYSSRVCLSYACFDPLVLFVTPPHSYGP